MWCEAEPLAFDAACSVCELCLGRRQQYGPSPELAATERDSDSLEVCLSTLGQANLSATRSYI